MKVLALPHASVAVVLACFAVQAWAIYVTGTHPGFNLLALVAAFFVGGFVTDLISGLAHFGFDYVWPANMPILGPISVDFRGHHERPGLDPSAVTVNLTKGGYGAAPVALMTAGASYYVDSSTLAFFALASGTWTSIWMLGFHQIHAYAHMGKTIPAEQFNHAVERIVQLQSKQAQKEAFAALFAAVGIPKTVRLLQRSRLFLRPEIHWRHHHTFETDFSSVNGWSDPLMNLLYKPIAKRLKAHGHDHHHHNLAGVGSVPPIPGLDRSEHLDVAGVASVERSEVRH
jgi:hypothetical protein